jgi:hypothetical protein
MSNRIGALVVLAVALPVGSAPRLKDQPAAAYYPTTGGDRSVTETRFQSATVESIGIVTAVETKDGAMVVSVGRKAEGTVGPAVSQVKVTDQRSRSRRASRPMSRTVPTSNLRALLRAVADRTTNAVNLPRFPGSGTTATTTRSASCGSTRRCSGTMKQ